MLQREFGISAEQALLERPVWELENLIAQYVIDQQQEEV